MFFFFPVLLRGTDEGSAQIFFDCSSHTTGAICISLCGADAVLWWVGGPARWRIRRAKCEIKQQMKPCSLWRQNPAAVIAGKYVWFPDPGCNHTHCCFPFQSTFQLWASCLVKSTWNPPVSIISGDSDERHTCFGASDGSEANWVIRGDGDEEKGSYSNHSIDVIGPLT